jgi:hypothetical protein
MEGTAYTMVSRKQREGDKKGARYMIPSRTHS